MKVANIMPGDVIEVTVKYTEILVPEDGTYEYVFPTVVGPRYTGESKPSDIKGKDNWLVNPYLHQGEEAPYEFGISVNLNAGLSLGEVWVPSHKVKIDKKGGDRAVITLKPEEKNGGNRDYILRYKLSGNKINTGLLLYPGDKEKFFVLMLEPPENVNIDMVPPREYVFIVDVSGSMHGFPLDVSKVVIKKIVNSLRGKDYFNILFFAGGSEVLSAYPLQATEANKKKAIEMMMSQSGGGGTEILDAFQRALALEKKEGLSRIIVTATDGYVSVEKEVFDLIVNNSNEANFFAFGIGSGVNRYLIEGIARVGMGEPFIAVDEKEASNVADKFVEYIKHPLLTDIKVSFEGFDVYEVEPVSMPDLFARRPLMLYGKYKKASGNIKVTGKTVKGKYVKNIPVMKSQEDKQNTALTYIWAREKIARLADYGRVGVDVKKEVTELGLKYHLMTDFTSFVAVDRVIRKTGEVVTVKQPLPLPQGVSDYAVGGGYTATGGKASPSSPMMRACELSVDDRNGVVHISEPNLFITSGVMPANVALDDVGSPVMNQIKEELEKKFKEWGLTYLVVNLKVDKGKVLSLQVKKYTGKKCDAAALEKIFKKLQLPIEIQGNMELEMHFM
ncbi:hypothetical protein A2Y85_03520 [candidate division WOR-3 bacterium RBG_13_43_14]|uniref:VWFA domain-containing protein n=1 Tax=candidate division WOR-3 bacterium RBG_13_43_14 TaxID=1802590 RepID=A0A1F4UHQ1_UNCW3|nr:MAG: hypothetical protein A2Y85_03520 [candidate division WOR-3 bacterium RBG_13_43_14]